MIKVRTEYSLGERNAENDNSKCHDNALKLSLPTIPKGVHRRELDSPIDIQHEWEPNIHSNKKMRRTTIVSVTIMLQEGYPCLLEEDVRGLYSSIVP